jgi:hypothetical protein
MLKLATRAEVIFWLEDKKPEDILADLDESESDEEDEEGFEEEDDSNIHPTKPSHVDFGKSIIKKGHVNVMKK